MESKSCMAGFVLKNTLSDNGGVTRGICKMDEQNNLTEVVETKNIVKTADGAEADGVAVDVNSLVSMNMWGLTPDFLDVLEKGFKEFFEKEVPGNPQKAEYLIPIFIGELLEQGKMSVKVLKTNDTWYGMTYHEDVAAVKGSFKEMLENGVYKQMLFHSLLILGIAFFMYICLFGLSFLSGKILHLQGDHQQLYSAMSAFGNIGFMGIPIVTSIFPERGMLYISVFTMIRYAGNVISSYDGKYIRHRRRLCHGWNPGDNSLLDRDVTVCILGAAVYLKQEQK